MEKTDYYKEIDRIIYRPSWTDTFKNLKIGEELKLNRNQITYNVARSSIRWIQARYEGYNFKITSEDRFQDKFAVKRIQ